MLSQAELMVNSCRPSNPPQQNAGVMLGVVLGMAAKMGRDKLTLLASPGLAPFGSWVEQLIAESTGKHGRGIDIHARCTTRPELHRRNRQYA